MKRASFFCCFTIGLSFFTETGFTQSPPIWRNWTPVDGLREVWCSRISMSPNGNVWINHGDVNEISVLDGYTVRVMKNPGMYYVQDWDFSTANIIHETESGHLWTNGPKGLKRFERGEWIHYDIGEISPEGFFPLDADRALILKPAHLSEFNAQTGAFNCISSATESSLERFNHLLKARDGGIWITGEKGLAKLHYDHSSSHSTPLWSEYPFNSQFMFHNLHTPWEGKEGQITGIAYSIGSASRSIVHFNGYQWNILLEPSPDVNFRAGWLDEYDQIWGLEEGVEGTVFCEKNGVKSTIEKEHSLSSRINHEFVASHGVFWLATWLGATRYAPPLWRTPSFLTDQTFYEIHKGPNNRLWFFARDFLGLLENGRWKTYPFPTGFIRGDIMSKWMNILGDGRVALMFFGQKGLLLFDPEKENFSFIRHPRGRYVRTPCSLQSGNLLVLTYKIIETAMDTKNFSIEIFDGMNYKLLLKEEKNWDVGITPFVKEIQAGDYLIVGLDGIGRYKNGEYRLISVDDQYQGHGARCALEVEPGKIWFGEENGIFEYDQNRWKVIRRGLNSVCSMIKAKDGSIWIATGDGILRFFQGSWIEHTFEDGLPKTSIRHIVEDSQGRIFTVSFNQIVSQYYPEADKDCPRAIMNPDNVQVIAPGGKAQFAFTGVDKWKYTKVDRLHYSHRVDTSEWTPFTKERVASYTSLAAGAHRFEVRAIDRNWNISSPISWDFEVLLPWYKEPEFLIIIFIGMVIILLLTGYALNRHLKLGQSLSDLRGANDSLNSLNAKLQETNAQLMQLDQMKTAFVSQASHDLRTPLTAIKSSMDNLVRGVGGGLNERQQSVVTRALRSVNRLTVLINDILDLNRIESGRVVLENTEILFESLVSNTIHENQPAAEHKRIAIQTNGLNEHYPVSVDVGKMERVVGELISNAIKYTPEGGNIEVNLKREHNNVIFKVKDSGIGMREEECEKIWERFYRTKSSQKFAKGSGLGLSIAKELVEMHQGTLNVESAVRTGSTFTMTLPIQAREGENNAGSEDSDR